MNRETTQKDLLKAWAKIELNSCYDLIPIPVISMEYGEKKVLQITKEGKKKLIVIQEALKSKIK